MEIVPNERSVLNYETSDNSPYFTEKLVEKYDNGEILIEYWNYSTPIEIGTTMKVDDEEIITTRHEGFINLPNVYIRQKPEISHNRFLFSLHHPSGPRPLEDEYSYFLPKGYRVKPCPVKLTMLCPIVKQRFSIPKTELRAVRQPRVMIFVSWTLISSQPAISILPRKTIS